MNVSLEITTGNETFNLVLSQFLLIVPPVVKVPRPETGAVLGQSAELECVVEGFPDPWVDWYNDLGELVRNVDDSYRTTNLVAGNEVCAVIQEFLKVVLDVVELMMTCILS